MFDAIKPGSYATIEAGMGAAFCCYFLLEEGPALVAVGCHNGKYNVISVEAGHV